MVISAEGALLTARIQVGVVADVVTVATVMRFERRVATIIWIGFGPAHCLVLRRFVDASA